MRKTATLLCVSILSFCGLRVTRAELLPGSPAPEMKVEKWVKGTPVDTFAPGQVYVLEYWATWCGPCKKAIPHVTELAKKYAGKVTFVGVDVWEKGDDTLPPVEAFVTKMGDQMNYNVAYDGPSKFMDANWLKAANVTGIPTTFVIDQTGKIAWIGHPMQMEPVLEKVLAGTWDTAAAAHLQKLKSADMAIIPKTNRMLNMGDYVGVKKEVDSMVAAEPAMQYMHYTAHYYFVAMCDLDAAKALEFANTWLATDQENPPYDDIAGVSHMMRPNNKSLALLSAQCMDIEIAKYGDTTDKAALYSQQSDFYLCAGDLLKATKAAELAVTDAESQANYAAVRLDKLKEKVSSLKSLSVVQ
jgi:thiol-disulfide isomerase/thioredoxin